MQPSECYGNKCETENGSVKHSRWATVRKWERKTHFSTMFFCLRIWWTSSAVAGPWSFWPFSSSFSSCSMVWTEEKAVSQLSWEMAHISGTVALHVLCLFWRRPPRSCGCVRRSRWWWDQPRRSSPRRWRARQGTLCRRPGRSWSSPSGPGGSRLPWCCRRIPGRRRNLPPPRRCSARRDATVKIPPPFGIHHSFTGGHGNGLVSIS